MYVLLTGRAGRGWDHERERKRKNVCGRYFIRPSNCYLEPGFVVDKMEIGGDPL